MKDPYVSDICAKKIITNAGESVLKPFSAEIGAMQKNAHLVDFEKCSSMRLLSLSEASTQPRSLALQSGARFVLMLEAPLLALQASK